MDVIASDLLVSALLAPGLLCDRSPTNCMLAAHARLAAADGTLLSASAQLHRWANGDDIECTIQCNGKNAGHIDGFPESWPLGSCWGEFRSVRSRRALVHRISSLRLQIQAA